MSQRPGGASRVRGIFRSGAGFRALGILSVALALALNILDVVPPLQDYGDWVYQGFLLNRILAGHATLVMLKPWPVPNALSQVVLGLGMFLLSPIAAAKTFICLYLVLFGLLCDWLTRNPDGSRDDRRFLLLVLLGVLNSAFWNGYVNFQLGLLLLLFYIGLRRRRRALALAVEALFGILIFFSHAICLGGFLLYVGWDGLLRRRIARSVAIAMPALLLVVWYLLANDAGTPDIPPQGRGGLLAFASYKIYTLAKLGPYQNFIVGHAGDFTRHRLLYGAGVLIDLAFAALFVVPLFGRIILSVAQRRFSSESLMSLVCLGGFLILPSTLFGVVNIGERVLAIAVVGAVLAAQTPTVWPSWPMRAGALLACALPLTIVGALAVTLGVGHDVPFDAAAIDRPGERTRLLFWHRSFEFLDEMQAAQHSARSGAPPTRLPGFDTSILAPRRS